MQLFIPYYLFSLIYFDSFLSHYSPRTTHLIIYYKKLFQNYFNLSPIVYFPINFKSYFSRIIHIIPLPRHYISHNTHFPLFISYHSSPTTHHTQLTSHYSSPTTHHTQLTSHYSFQTTHHITFITHPLISYYLSPIIFHTIYIK